MAGVLFIAFGLYAALFFKQWGSALARRHLADQVWFYQFLSLFVGLAFIAFGAALVWGLI